MLASKERLAPKSNESLVGTIHLLEYGTKNTYVLTLYLLLTVASSTIGFDIIAQDC